MFFLYLLGFLENILIPKIYYRNTRVKLPIGRYKTSSLAFSCPFGRVMKGR